MKENLKAYIFKKNRIQASFFIAILFSLSFISNAQNREIVITDATVPCSHSISNLSSRLKMSKFISQATTFSSGKKVHFLSYTPPSYDYKFEKYPLIIFMIGRMPYPNGTNDLCFLRQNLPHPVSIDNPNIVPGGENSAMLSKFVVICPQADVSISQTDNGGSVAWDPFLMNETIEMALQNFNVDPTRIYLIGTSRGGGHVYEYLLGNPLITSIPSQDQIPACNSRKIAAAAVFSTRGSHNPINACSTIVPANIPIWNFSIEGDAGGGRNVPFAMKDNQCNTNPKIRVTHLPSSDAYDNTFHWAEKFNSWLRGNSPINYYINQNPIPGNFDNEQHNTETNDLYSWLLSHNNRSEELINDVNSTQPICINTSSSLSISAITNGSYTWFHPSNKYSNPIGYNRILTTPIMPQAGTFTFWAQKRDNTTCIGFKNPVTLSVYDRNKSVYFNGAHRVIKADTINQNFGFGTREFTLETWLKISNSSIDNIYPLISTLNSNSGFMFYLATQSWGDKSELGFWTPSGPTNIKIPKLNINTWYHTAITRTGNTLTYYLNGALVGTTTINTPITVNRELYIGSDPLFSYSGSLNIDDVKIWNRARSAPEISAGTKARISAANTNLIAYYPFNDFSSSQSYMDLTRFKNTLTKGSTQNVELNDPASSYDVPYGGCRSGSAREGEAYEVEGNNSQAVVFPNPAKSIVRIKLNQPQDVFIQIVDSKGIIVMEGKYSTEEDVDIAQLKGGLYSLLINTNTNRIVERLVITE